MRGAPLARAGLAAWRGLLLLVSNVGRWVVGLENGKVGRLSYRCVITIL